MSDTSKKRSRKSKLVPRDCGEDEGNKKMRMEKLTRTLLSELETEDRQLDSLPSPLQTVLPKLRTQLDKTYDHDEADTSTRDINFSVNVEVEECDSNDDNNRTDTKKLQRLQWPIFIPEEEYRSSVDKLSKITRALADKILEVHISNYLGRYVNEAPHVMDYFEASIQDNLIYVQKWQKSSKLRDAILSYKCYVCDIGWWHLGPFKEHIREHGKGIRISFQTSCNEGCIIAHVDQHSDFKEIPIEGRCWQCMKTWDEHVNLKRNPLRVYTCVSCTFKSPNCSALLQHEGLCLRYQKEHIKETINYETKSMCTICNTNCITESRLKAHMALSHFVRSDFPCVPVRLRTCPFCNLKYVFHVLHTCRNRSQLVYCNYCIRRFPGRTLADIHMTHSKKNVCCRVCHTYLRSQCMEAEHMVKHSKNYVQLYKCVVCPNNTFFNSEDSMKAHKREHSDYKYTKNIFFEMVLAPRKLFPSLPFNEDEMIAPVKPHILGPILAPLPKKRLSVDIMSAEAQSAVEAIRCDRHDGHDYLYRPYDSVTEMPCTPAPNDETQQVSESDDTLAAIQSITDDVAIKTETEDYGYYDQTEMDIVYEDIDIKKEEFLDTLSNAFVSAEDVTDCIDDQDICNVFKMSKQLVTVIKKEKKINELLNDGDGNKEEVAVKAVEIEIKKENQSDEDDFADDIIVLNDKNKTDDLNDGVPFDEKNDNNYLVPLDKNNYNDVVPADENGDNHVGNDVHSEVPVHENDGDNDLAPVNESDKNNVVPVDVDENDNNDDIIPVDENEDDVVPVDVDENDNNDDIVPVDENKDTDEDDDVTIINEVKETIDISDTEMQETDDDSNKSSDQIHETSSNESNKESNKTHKESSEIKKENNKKKVKVKKERAKNKMYKCTKCYFVAEHKEYKEHIKSHGIVYTRTKKVIPEPWSNYPCTKCNCTFSTLKKYIQHLKAHKIPLRTCPECLEIFTNQSQLAVHLTGHIRRLFTKIYIILEKDTFITSKQDNVYQCKKCCEVVKYGKFFKHWEGHMKLGANQPKVKRQIKVECKIERNEEVEDGSLADMELSAELLKQLLELLRAPGARGGGRSHACFLCGRPFARAPYLKRHYVEHLLRDALARRVRAAADGIACQICDDQFTDNLQYKQHMRNHASLPVYRCELCAHNFSDSSNFAKHKKTHNMTAAICDVCGAKFVKRDTYLRHMKMHRQTAPVQCAQCPALFHRASHHKKHVRAAHARRPARYGCGVCLAKFPSTRAQLDHLWAAHRVRRKKVDCPVCGRSFRKFIDMKYHLRIKHNAGLRMTSQSFFNASEADRTYSWVHLNSRGRMDTERSGEEENWEVDEGKLNKEKIVKDGNKDS